MKKTNLIASMTTFYASPGGTGSGNSPSSPIDVYASQLFSQLVPTALANGPVTVQVEAGIYTGWLSLNGIGHPQHLLTIRGTGAGQVVFQGDTLPQGAGSDGVIKTRYELMRCYTCQNIRLENLQFSGAAPLWNGVLVDYSCQRITFSQCQFIDLPEVKYAAMALTCLATQVEVLNCRFERVGKTDLAHMIYASHGVTYLRVQHCYFEDCPGTHIQLRNWVDHCVVSDCHFLNTGNFPIGNRQARGFVGWVAMNDRYAKPGGCQDVNFGPDECFGTHFTITRNRFRYGPDVEAGVAGFRWPLRFFHLGWNPVPPGSTVARKHLLSAAEVQLLKGDDKSTRKALLKNNLALDTEHFVVYGNVFEHAAGTAPDQRRWFMFLSQARPHQPTGTTTWPTAQPWDEAIEVFDLFQTPSRSVRHRYHRKLIHFS